MANPITINGSQIRLYLNNKVYSVTQSVSLDYDLGTYEIHGINAPYAQEITPGQVHIRGSVRGVRTKNSGGLQGAGAIPLFQDIIAGNYISLRVEDRNTQESIWTINKALISKITEVVQIKGLYYVSFEYQAQIVYYPLDLS